MSSFKMFALASLCALVALPAHAQVQTGSIVGTVTDSSSAVLPGVTVSLSGERLIGGVQTQTTDAGGTYRFDRLPPGGYRLKFELQGFRAMERDEIRVNASFVATVNVKLEVGSLSESITVTGESPTVDTKSNLQQTVMTQEILEGVPTGRDPWSLAKLIPGVQVATYDVGGTQSIQQSSLSAHGSNTNDVNYNIDGAVVNWPGGGGGATMLYYDQGMFEEVNYMTSAIPAEVLAGGVSINMVTKDAGNKWRGNARYYFANDKLQSENHIQPGFPSTFLGNPTKKLYDFNLAGGGALAENRLWVNGTVRRWVVNKLTTAKNPDGSQALDDNTLKNYSGKAVAAISPNQKASFSYLWNNKIRGHRRDTPPDLVPDVAALVQTNPASATQARYTGIRNKLVYESSFSVMDGQTNYKYQPNTSPDAIRKVDNTLSTAEFAASRDEELPNQRTQFDNIVSYGTSGFGGEHVIKAGVQFARLYYESLYKVQGDHYVEYSNGRPTQVREFNTPTNPRNIEHVLGFFAQDSWTVASRLTLNLGVRFDHNTGILPAQSNPGNAFIGPRSIEESTPIKQNIAVWRTGASYDPRGNGQTAVKASYSRYGLQVGIDRVTGVNPLSNSSQTCPWTDPNGDGTFQASEVVQSSCSGFPGVSTRYAGANGPSWPYSDEVTAGVEQQVMRDMRVGAMFYYRTNRDQLGTRNLAVPPSAYVPFTTTVPNGPNGPATVTAYNLLPAFNGLQNNIVDSDAFLDTEYKGVELTANKRFSNRWQMVAGLTFGKNTGGVNTGGFSTGGTSSGQMSTLDLNDPNNTLYDNGVIGNDSKVAFRLSGSYQAPGSVSIAGTMLSNGGYPYYSSYAITRASVAPAVALTRASQVIPLSRRGDERLPTVTMVDLRISRPVKFGQRQIVPQLDLFNIGNAATIVRYNVAVGSTYLTPVEIVAPRIVRVGFSIDF
jgi:outer membrane receptor protein involved in Fe transport